MQFNKKIFLTTLCFSSAVCSKESNSNSLESLIVENNANENINHDSIKESNDLRIIDLQKYLGEWYEIYRYPTWFEDKGDDHATDVKATYTEKDCYIEVLNTSIDKYGRLKSVKGKAKVIEDPSHSKLSVSFSIFQQLFNYFFAKKGNYWILDLSQDYQWAIVGGPEKNYLWVLARNKTLDEQTTNHIMKKITLLGYNCAKLIKTKHQI